MIGCENFFAELAWPGAFAIAAIALAVCVGVAVIFWAATRF